MRKVLLLLAVGITFLFGKVDINSASIGELSALKGIGVKTAERIVEYREKSCFSSIEDLTKVKGIGKKKFSMLEKDIEAKPCEQ